MFVRMWMIAAVAVGISAHALPGAPSFARFAQPAPVYPAGLREGFEKSLRMQLAHSLKLPEEQFAVSIELARVEPTPVFSKVSSVQVLGLGSTGSTRLDGLISLPVVAQADGKSVDLIVSGILSVTGPVVTARMPLPRGHIVREGDVDVARLPWKLLPSGAAGTSLSSILGQRVRNFINAGAPIYSALVDEPLAVKSGDVVELTVVSGPGVMIRSRAFAKQEGRLGDLIRLEQPDTKKALRGIVTGDKKVEVRL